MEVCRPEVVGAAVEAESSLRSGAVEAVEAAGTLHQQEAAAGANPTSD